MPDTIGRISVPEIAASGTFPLIPDYPHGRAIEPVIQVHRFGSANAKIEQRYLAGPGITEYRVVRRGMSFVETNALRTFWEARLGAYQPFTYNVPPDAHGGATVPTICRFRDDVLSLNHLAAALADTGITLVEEPQSFPIYTSAATLERFPDAGMEAAGAAQVQEFIPLVKIRVKETAVPDIFLSTRRLTVDGQLYQARLLRAPEGIAQQTGGTPDDALFACGNADRVMQALANDTNLDRARMEFSFLHVQSLILLNLWAGEVNDWRRNGLTEFVLQAADPAADINLVYPPETVSRGCWKPFNVAGGACPAAAAGGSNLGDPCDKGFDTAQGCQYHTMDDFYGGVQAQPQLAHIKDNSQGRFGFGRPRIPVSSMQSDSIYGQVLRRIITDGIEITVNCLVAAYREESDFRAALAIVGKGPLGAYATPVFPAGSNFGDPKFRMDNQPWHGFKDGDFLGLHANMFEPSLGPDPNDQPFAIDYDPLSERRAGGTAFFFIRIADEPGIQLSSLEDHVVTATISEGLSGYAWTGPGGRSTLPLANPVWLMVNAYLEARGLWFASAGEQEAELDIDACVAAADICDESVTKIIGSGSATQFVATGVIEQQQPLRAWMQDILNNCLGDFTFRFGKLRPIIRVNSSAVEAFTVGNIIWNTLDAQFARPEFNYLRGNFANSDRKFAADEVALYDEEHGGLIAPSSAGIVRLPKDMSYSLSSTADQVGRLVTTRLREELGGITPDDWKRRRRVMFQTTLLGLSVDPGMVISVTDGEFDSEAAGGNVGNGTLSAVTFSGPAAPGANRVVITAASPGAGDFDVLDPDDNVIGSGTVGVAFEGGGLSFTLAAGGIDFAIGDEFTITMSEQEMPGGTGELRVEAWRLNSDFSISVEGVTTVDGMYDYTVGPKPDDVEPDAVPEEITGNPQQPVVVFVALRDGYVRLSPSFPSYGGPERMTTALEWGIFAVNELVPHETELAESIDNLVTTFDLVAIGTLVAGSWFEIASEIFYITEDPVGNTVTVERGTKSSTAVAHTIGDKVWKVDLYRRTNSFPINTFTGLPGSPGDNVRYSHLLPSVKVVAFEVQAVNARGKSPLKVFNTSFLQGTGIRTYAGLTLSLPAAGAQDGAADDIVPPGTTTPIKVSIGVIKARVKDALSGGECVYRVNVAGVEVGQVTIEDGESVGTLNGIDIVTGDLLGVIDVDEIVTVDRVSGSGGGVDLELQVRC